MRILGLGDNVIDEYVNTGACYPGGNAVNFACHIAKLDVESAYLGNLADDRYAKIIEQALEEMHVVYDHCPVIKDSSTKRCLYSVVDGEREFLKVDLGNNWSAQVDVQSNIQYISSFDAVHCCCNAKMEEQMHLLWDIDTVFTYDFGEKEKYRNEEYYQKICKRLDLALFSCNPMSIDEAKQFCAPLHALGVKHVLITMGSYGQYISNGTDICKGTIEKVDAVDTMGAGDAFCAALVKHLVQNGWKKDQILDIELLQSALAFASVYAKSNCMVEGGFGIRGKIEEIIHVEC